MSFFEAPVPSAPEPREPEPKMPPWFGPPDNVLGVVVPIQRMLARTDNVAIALAGVVAYPAGCIFQLQLAARRGEGDLEAWYDVEAAFFQEPRIRHRAGRAGELPAEWLRCGVQFADGRKATNTASPPRWDITEPPAAPVLLEHGGGGGSGGEDRLSLSRHMWLWPLPPPEPISLVIEWPIVAIPLTRSELDGAAIVEAAARAESFWPEPEPA